MTNHGGSMKLLKVAFVAALASTPLAYAQSDHMKGMDMGGHGKEAAKAPQSSAHHATGTVKSVDAGKGTVSIAHGPVATLNWPAMTMKFKAKDRRALEQLKPGAKVEFEFEQQGKDYVITKVK